jgi:tetratricopeptide (TPR) repeat protein/tRNA A-37 threonylcarbamoyl transferase component Bud32
MIGSLIGHYLITERLGEGGMGEVFLVEDQKLHRKAALKLIRADLTRDPARRQRFMQEATLAASIDHPHICAIYDIDEADGRTFIAMEYVEGRSLRELLRQGPLTLRRALDLALQMADALAKVHERGVVHRDLKPDNVLVSADGYAKIIDFGIAKLVDPLARAGVADAATLTEVHIRTADGVVLGTLGYMSPEQVKGESVDARSDIFSFGALLYEMVGGTPPFKRTSPAETMSAILTAPTAPIRIQDPQVEPELQRILRKCLVKEPGGRYQTMRDLVVDLRGARESLASGETTARSAAPAMDVGSRTVAIVAAAVVVIAAVVGAWLWTRRAEPVETAVISTSTPVRPAVAVLPFEVISGGADIAWLGKGLPSLLTTGLAQTPDIEVVGPERLSDAARSTGAKTLDAVDRSRHADLARRAGARFIINGTIVQAGADLRIDARVEDLSTGAIRVAASVRGPDAIALADDLSTQIRKGLDVQAAAHKVAEVTSGSIDAYRAYNDAAEALFSGNRAADAERLYREAIRLDPGFAMAHVALAYIAESRGREQDQRASLNRAAEHLDRLTERDQLMVRAELARADERFDEAARLFETVMDRYPDTEAAYYRSAGLSDILSGVRPDSPRAVAIIERGLKALPYSPGFYNNFGYALVYNGRVDDALRAEETYVKLRPAEHNTLDSLAEVQFIAGDLPKAIETYSRALAAGHTTARGLRGWVLAVAGRYDEALVDAPADSSSAIIPNWIHVWIVSRLGRYRDAGKDAANARSQLDPQDDAKRAWLFLIDASFLLERSECDRIAEPIGEAERAASRLSTVRRRPMLVVADLIAGTCDARSGRLGQARSRLAQAKSVHAAGAPHERWWAAALEGEIALTSGDAAGAARSFAAGEPDRKMIFNRFQLLAPLSFLANNLVLRDGRARAAVAQGRLDEAIALYRGLLTSGRESKWTAMLEPRYVLALARLLDKAGQPDAAKAEYRRFLELWKNADPDLPELKEAHARLG